MILLNPYYWKISIFSRNLSLEIGEVLPAWEFPRNMATLHLFRDRPLMEQKEKTGEIKTVVKNTKLTCVTARVGAIPSKQRNFRNYSRNESLFRKAQVVRFLRDVYNEWILAIDTITTL